MEYCLSKGQYLSKHRAENIITGAGEILSHTGIRISSLPALERLKESDKIIVKDNRAYIPTVVYEDFLRRYQNTEQKKNRHGMRLSGEPSLYTYHYRDAISHKIRTYTMETLAQMTRFVEKSKKRYPVLPAAPGYPSDVPAELSSLARYKIDVENCSGSWMTAPDSVISADYMFEMADIMGQKMTHLPVYMISPLTLGGDALEIVLKHADQLKSFYTFAMPNMGVTTPMNLSMGLSMALAEVVGGAVLVEFLTGLEADIKPNLFPFDLKNFNIAFGSPEKFLMEQMAAELTAWIRKDKVDYTSTNIHTWAKGPDGISAMEKGMLIMAGAMSGAKKFYCVGTVSLDELFDPLQMIQDLEEIKYAQRLMDGLPSDEMEDTFLEEIQEGIRSGFVISDRTLDDYETYLVSADISPKENLQKWMADGSKNSKDYLNTIYQEITELPFEYALDSRRQTDLNQVFERALKAFNSK